MPGEYTSDYLVDAEDVTALLERIAGAHLVGHSYGGVPAMLAAAARRDLITSLVLIEHGPMSVAGNEPVAEVLQRNRAGMARLPRDMDPETYVRAWPSPSVWPCPR